MRRFAAAVSLAAILTGCGGCTVVHTGYVRSDVPVIAEHIAIPLHEAMKQDACGDRPTAEKRSAVAVVHNDRLKFRLQAQFACRR